MNRYVVATTLIKQDLANIDTLTDLRLIEANSESEAIGMALMRVLEEQPEHHLHLKPIALLVTENLDITEPRKQYEEETGRGCLAAENGGVTGAYTADYVYWLEAKLSESANKEN